MRSTQRCHSGSPLLCRRTPNTQVGQACVYGSPPRWCDSRATGDDRSCDASQGRPAWREPPPSAGARLHPPGGHIDGREHQYGVGAPKGSAPTRMASTPQRRRRPKGVGAPKASTPLHGVGAPHGVDARLTSDCARCRSDHGSRGSKAGGADRHGEAAKRQVPSFDAMRWHAMACDGMLDGMMA